MGIFNSFFNRKDKDKDKELEGNIQINDLSSGRRCSTFVFCHDKHKRPIGEVYLQTIVNKIWSGVENISIETTKNDITAEDVCRFIDKNAQLIVNQYIRVGYICIFYNKNGEYFIPKDSDIRKDANGRVVNRSCVVLYSPLYQTDRKSLLGISMPIIAGIDKIAGTKEYLNDTLGCFGILSGQDIPLNPVGKQQMLEGMKDMYGTAADKYQFMLANNDIKYTNITPDLDGLKLDERLKEEYKLLANLWGIPLPLLFDEASTYNNVKEAKIYFYDTTIRSYAEVLLRVARELLTAQGEFVPQAAITYHLSNVPELEKTLSSAVEQRKTLLDYYLSLKAAGVDTDKEINALYEESKDLLTSV